MNLNVVLFEPEIPQNTGTIGRLCLATGSTLHLVEPLGFEISHSRLKRAGLDYWEHLSLKIHPNLESLLDSIPVEAQVVFVEEKAGPLYFDFQFEAGAYLIFGKETTGIPDRFLNRYADRTVRIPMFDARVRSLNLSQSVGIVVYEAIRQIQSHGLHTHSS